MSDHDAIDIYSDSLWELRQEVAEIRNHYERACQTIAEMHAAAVGEIRGPTRGVVEDIQDLRDRLLRHEGALVQAKSLALHAGDERTWTYIEDYLREAMRRDLANGVCQHEATSPGPSVGLRYGSSQTEVCDSCGWYRLTFNPPCHWQPGPVDTTDEEEL